tara:strand:- start:771 stop:1301 length:531 start_codon:yes stop_codon:yes gene_type:complete
LTKETIICDIDGTIADIKHRLHYIKDYSGNLLKNPDWDSFNQACLNDQPIIDVIRIVKLLWLNGRSQSSPEFNLKFFTGRNTLARENTLRWLIKNFFNKEASPHDKELLLEKLGVTLSMREETDFRDDSVIKLEMMQQFKLLPENVLCIFEDRHHVVEMWRDNGYRVMQVDYCNDR